MSKATPVFDLQLCVNHDNPEVRDALENLSNTVEIESSFDLGWGYRISSEENLPFEVFSAQLDSFLEACESIIDIVDPTDALLRVGVYFHTANFTWKLAPQSKLSNLPFEVELSFYPCGDD